MLKWIPNFPRIISIYCNSTCLEQKACKGVILHPPPQSMHRLYYGTLTANGHNVEKPKGSNGSPVFPNTSMKLWKDLTEKECNHFLYNIRLNTAWPGAVWGRKNRERMRSVFDACYAPFVRIRISFCGPKGPVLLLNPIIINAFDDMVHRSCTNKIKRIYLLYLYMCDVSTSMFYLTFCFQTEFIYIHILCLFMRLCSQRQQESSCFPIQMHVSTCNNHNNTRQESLQSLNEFYKTNKR